MEPGFEADWEVPFRFRDPGLASRIIDSIKSLGVNARYMHVCGTHQDTLVKYGLEPLLKSVGIEVRAGPGCPICVTTGLEYEEAIALAEAGKTVAAFGDAARAPGFNRSLLDARAGGCKVKIVYSIRDAVRLAEKESGEIVFMAVGFETTAPSTAATLTQSPPENFYVLSCHRVIPPAVKALLDLGEIKLNGLIQPGHVSTIIGLHPYREISYRYGIPQVVAGFEPLDLLMAVYMLSRQMVDGRSEVENEYSRTVKPDGNIRARRLMEEVFEPCDLAWRGFPEIRGSGLKLKSKFEAHDARAAFQDILEPVYEKFQGLGEPSGCRCGDVLRGVLDPRDCPLFGRRCNPKTPAGPCMVSIEGTCYIRYRYGEGQA
ncbi:MAG: hydrogenase formation protein HypD [Candidatus Bathyarchaeia archaeon]|nr:hydrogenase formation protein HypD [Candidatus Bathyarchaeota archaeon]